MQYFPVSSTANPTDIAQIFGPVPNKTPEGGDFGSVLSSFIEEGRTDYTGLPPGFSAHVQESGTLDQETTDSFKKAMRDRKVPEAALDTLDQLTASGLPATIGRIFSVLGGNTRISAPLEGDDRVNFMQLMGKMGFTKDESEELLGMVDDGKSGAAWKRIAGKLKGLGGEGLELHGSELSTLMKGLDLSEKTQKSIAATFGQGDSKTLSQAQLEKLLAAATVELDAREAAQKTAQANMRDAMNQVLQDKKLKENSAQVSDARGSRRSDQSEALMHESLRKKTGGIFGDKEGVSASAQTGADQTGIKADPGRRDSRDTDESPRDRRDDKSRAERILTTTNDKKTESATGKIGQGSQSVLDRMMQRIDVAAQGQQPAQTSGQQVPAQDLNSMAGRFRQEIFSQVETGMLQNMQNGSRQLTLQLTPDDLGQVTVILSVHQGEVRARIRTENQESATALTEQMAELKSSLEAQGFKVKELDVQTQMQNNSQADQWNGTREHNLMQDAQERDRITRLSQMRREAGSGSGTLLEAMPEHIVEQSGLHIVA